MGTRLQIDEVVWRGPMVLVKLPSEKMVELFLDSTIQIFWGDECRANGIASTFLDEGYKPAKRLLLNIVGINDPDKFNQPTRMIIDYQGQKQELPIKLLEKGQKRFSINFPFLVRARKPKELTV